MGFLIHECVCVCVKGFTSDPLHIFKHLLQFKSQECVFKRKASRYLQLEGTNRSQISCSLSLEGQTFLISLNFEGNSELASKS